MQTRYYDAKIGRFANPDTSRVLTATPMSLTDKNLYAYCDNNPVVRVDVGGKFWESIWDVISLGSSIKDVADDPSDPWAWVGLVGDAADVLIPFLGGIGEAVRGIKAVSQATEVVDTVSDVKKGWKVGDDITNLTKAGNDPSWSTVRRRYWKNEAFYFPESYTDADLERMRKGLARIGDDNFPMELHHPNGREGKYFFDFYPLTKSEHYFRHYGRWPE